MNFHPAGFPVSSRRVLISVLLAAGLAGCASVSSPTAEWSDSKREPVGPDFPSAHGLFNAGPVSVTARDLPDHAWVRVRFKLIVTGTWDGSSRVWGPDLWSLQVRGGPQLMFTGFCNMGGFVNNRSQAYPDDFPWGSHAAWTGAIPLGAKAFPGLGDDNPQADAAYPIEVVFPHEGKTLTLDFAGIYDDPPGEKQRWAVAGFEYVTMAGPVKASPAELSRLWDDMASPESVRANEAMWKLISTGADGVAFVTSKVDALAKTFAEAPSRLPFRGAEALRLRRADKMLRIADAEHAGRVRYWLEHHYPEYFEPPGL